MCETTFRFAGSKMGAMSFEIPPWHIDSASVLMFRGQRRETRESARRHAKRKGEAWFRLRRRQDNRRLLIFLKGVTVLLCPFFFGILLREGCLRDDCQNSVLISACNSKKACSPPAGNLSGRNYFISLSSAGFSKSASVTHFSFLNFVLGCQCFEHSS